MSIILSNNNNNNNALPLPHSNKLNNILNSDDQHDHYDHVDNEDNDQPLMLEKKLFEDKHLIKPWLQSKLVHKGINIVIERSDDTKIVFKCKNTNLNGKNRRYKKRKLLKKIEDNNNNNEEEDNNNNNNNNNNNDEADDEEKNSILKNKRSCPFRIRANFSLRAKKWSIVIVNDQHNHNLYPIINDTSSKLTENLTSRNSSSEITDNNNNSNTNSSKRRRVSISSISSNTSSVSSASESIISVTESRNSSLSNSIITTNVPKEFNNFTKFRFFSCCYSNK
ncbi:unnamed protein product [[Candida] boidinii]|uniref:Unnamed protein product n=1 Tax=Candida boidinii TaxID=5477 RepID=A0ACB5U188_CANBO|nr:unnamed protein product [[Candida] boidinii]